MSEQEPNCQVCNDNGFVLYTRVEKKLYSNVEGGIPCTYVAHCVCQAGEKWKYNGNKWRVPSVTEVYGNEPNA